jgi:hypothetical protein
LAVVGFASAGAAEATVGADVASAYVFRGVTFNDGFVLQPYVDVSGLPIDLGFWANMDLDDMDGDLTSGEISELDIWLSYTLPLGIDGLDVSVGYCEYLYPGIGGGVNEQGEEEQGEADRELSLTVGLSEIPLAPELTLAYGVGGAPDKSLHAELGLGQSVDLCEDVSLDLGASVAYESPDEGDDGFSYYTASAGLSYAFLSASVTYVGQIDDDVLTDDDYDVEVYGTVGASYTF